MSWNEGGIVVPQAGIVRARPDGNGKPFDILAALAAARNASVFDRPIWVARKSFAVGPSPVAWSILVASVDAKASFSREIGELYRAGGAWKWRSNA